MFKRKTKSEAVSTTSNLHSPKTHPSTTSKGQPTFQTEDLEKRFSSLTHLIYNTQTKVQDLDEHVAPFLDEHVSYEDPFQFVSGKNTVLTQLKGCHLSMFFESKIEQLDIQMKENQEGGRVLIDAWMNMNQFKWIIGTFPIRTILVYDFVMINEGSSFLITNLKEMWSLGDVIEQIPFIGWCFNLFRHGGGWFFTFFFFLCSVVMKWLHVMFQINNRKTGNVWKKVKQWASPSLSEKSTPSNKPVTQSAEKDQR
ncbi:hypothetical protein FDP41_006341 [Naegleria fowleri]|uniref:Uncharacterized protein n=1 Tax=Naegleria fowleri TaxID=5763 RepID=A0A6A5BCS8_NAEFO|nr:uncharacterized protein FDP41_006341 [Naegleria fowleri]KAF0974867.1 hypothetical protein FDP41_006341 [Naegleria fowleri]CAG4712009.1 unnamed protein product [Naegleria fowleri]